MDRTLNLIQAEVENLPGVLRQIWLLRHEMTQGGQADLASYVDSLRNMGEDILHFIADEREAH